MAVSASALAGVISGIAFLPKSRRSPLGVALGGVCSLAYRGLLMAATPVVAQRITEAAAPERRPRLNGGGEGSDLEFPDDLNAKHRAVSHDWE